MPDDMHTSAGGFISYEAFQKMEAETARVMALVRKHGGSLGALAEKCERLERGIESALDGHFEYLPPAVEFYCCAGCNRLTSGYVMWPCPLRAALPELR